MRWTGLLAIAIMLATASPSYGQHRERLSELLPEIDAFEHPPLVENIRKNVASEFGIRNTGFAQSRGNILRQDDPGPMHDDWADFHQTQADERNQNFLGFIDDAREIIEDDGLPNDPVHPALVWLNQIRAEQVAVQLKVKAMPVAVLRDLLAVWTTVYGDEVDELEDEQRLLESSDDGADRDGRGYRQALVRACTDLRRQKTEAERDLVNLVGASIEPDSTESHAQTMRSPFMREIDRLVDSLETFDDSVGDAIGRLLRTMEAERTFIRALIARRREVQAFEQSFNLSTAQVRFAINLDLAMTRAGDVDPDGDVDDLGEFVDLARTDLEPALEGFEDVYETFMTDFAGVFLPPFNNATSEPFVEMAVWERWAGEVQSCDPVELIDSVRESNDRDWGAERFVNAVRNEDAREVFEDILDEGHDRVDAAIRRARAQAQRLRALSELRERRALLDELNRS